MARPDGWRLVFLSSLRSHLLESLAAGLGVPAVVSAPVLVFVWLPIVGWEQGFAAVGQAFLVWLVLVLVMGAVLAIMVASAPVTDVRWVDLQPGRSPATLTVWRGSRPEEIPLATVLRVTVMDRYRLDAFLGVRVVFQTRTQTITGDFRTGKRPVTTKFSDSAGLAAWLTECLTPAGVEVDRETVTERALLPKEAWWPAPKVAAMWDVAVELVPGIAQEHGIRSETWLPRAGALHSPGRPVAPHYDPDDVCRLARERRGFPDEQIAAS